MLEQTPESAAADDVRCLIGLIGLVNQLQAVQRFITQPLVRPLMVVVIDVLFDKMPKVLLAEDDEVIQTLEPFE